MDGFKESLRAEGLSESTVGLYAGIAQAFARECGVLDEASLAAWRVKTTARCKPATVNVRVNAVNRYLAYCGLGHLKQDFVKEVRSSFTDNVVDEDDYLLLKARLKLEGYHRDYFAVWTMAATGVRISELLALTRADFDAGFADVAGKGGKVRRVWIPARLQRDAVGWAEGAGLTGRLFLNARGNPITARGLAQQIKSHARRYGLDDTRVHPHAFRHYFAKKCLDSMRVDLPTLADMLGHSSIETTRIYLRRSSREQQMLIDQVVTW